MLGSRRRSPLTTESIPGNALVEPARSPRGYSNKTTESASFRSFDRPSETILLCFRPYRFARRWGSRTGELGGIALSQMHDADPFGSFRITNGPATTQVALLVGESDLHSAPMKVYINASGWLASLSYERPFALTAGTDENCLGAVAAACLGVAQLFKTAVAAPRERSFREGIFDLFRLEWVEGPNAIQAPWPEHQSIDVLMVGAGSVGSAAAYCMRLAQFVGRMTIIDHDHAKVENFNRSPLFGRNAFMLSKSEVAANFFQDSQICAHPLQMCWDDFVRTREREAFDFDVWLPLANEHKVRSAMQNNIPPLMINAGTTSDWGVNHGRHIPGKDDCLVDRFRTLVTADNLTCATLRILKEVGSHFAFRKHEGVAAKQWRGESDYRRKLS